MDLDPGRTPGRDRDLGYRWIHWAMQATAVVVGVSLIIMFIQGLRPTAGLFLAGVALLVIDKLSFGPFVSDYTRYLPAATSGRRLFWAICPATCSLRSGHARSAPTWPPC